MRKTSTEEDKNLKEFVLQPAYSREKFSEKGWTFSGIGGTRVVDVLFGEQLPCIC